MDSSDSDIEILSIDISEDETDEDCVCVLVQRTARQPQLETTPKRTQTLPTAGDLQDKASDASTKGKSPVVWERRTQHKTSSGKKVGAHVRDAGPDKSVEAAGSHKDSPGQLRVSLPIEFYKRCVGKVNRTKGAERQQSKPCCLLVSLSRKHVRVNLPKRRAVSQSEGRGASPFRSRARGGEPGSTVKRKKVSGVKLEKDGLEHPPAAKRDHLERVHHLSLRSLSASPHTDIPPCQTLKRRVKPVAMDTGTQATTESASTDDYMDADYRLALRLNEELNGPSGTADHPAVLKAASDKETNSLQILEDQKLAEKLQQVEDKKALHFIRKAAKDVKTPAVGPIPSPPAVGSTMGGGGGANHTQATEMAPARLLKLSSTNAAGPDGFPLSWTTCHNCPPHLARRYHLIEVEFSDEWQQVASPLTARGFGVIKVQRIQNASLWQRFQSERQLMMQGRPEGFTANETLLYHTSRADKAIICEEGLDQRLSRAGLFGSGIYFSDDPTKCNQYWSGRGRRPVMFACRVLLGNSKVFPHGHCDRTLRREPINPLAKPGEPKTFDSVQGNMTWQNEFVVYNTYRVLPEYAIEYENHTSCPAPRQQMLQASVPFHPGSAASKHRSAVYDRLKILQSCLSSSQHLSSPRHRQMLARVQHLQAKLFAPSSSGMSSAVAPAPPSYQQATLRSVSHPIASLPPSTSLAQVGPSVSHAFQPAQPSHLPTAPKPFNYPVVAPAFCTGSLTSYNAAACAPVFSPGGLFMQPFSSQTSAAGPLHMVSPTASPAPFPVYTACCTASTSNPTVSVPSPPVTSP